MTPPKPTVSPFKNGDTPVFDEAWHAQVLAVADSLVQAGRISPIQWAEALGAERRNAVANKAPDTVATYYDCALKALESLLNDLGHLDADTLKNRKTQWEKAYLATPHGQPVVLSAGAASAATGRLHRPPG